MSKNKKTLHTLTGQYRKCKAMNYFICWYSAFQSFLSQRNLFWLDIQGK